jgi:hypothetical protein
LDVLPEPLGSESEDIKQGPMKQVAKQQSGQYSFRNPSWKHLIDSPTALVVEDAGSTGDDDNKVKREVGTMTDGEVTSETETVCDNVRQEWQEKRRSSETQKLKQRRL